MKAYKTTVDLNTFNTFLNQFDISNFIFLVNRDISIASNEYDAKIDKIDN